MDERHFSGAASLDEPGGRRQTWLLVLLAGIAVAIAVLVALRFVPRTPRARTAQPSEPHRIDIPVTVTVPPPARVVPSGLRLVSEVPGTGASCQRGLTCTVKYRGFLWTGQRGALFDETTQRGPFAAKPEQLIPGFAEAITRLRVGGRSTVIIPPELAYGSRVGLAKIPPGSSLLFEIELVGVR